MEIASGVAGDVALAALRALLRVGRVEAPGLEEREEECEPAFLRLGRSIGQVERGRQRSISKISRFTFTFTFLRFTNTYQDSSRLHLPRGQYERTLSTFLPEVRDLLYM